MACIACGAEPEKDSVGFMICPVTYFIGQKSGLPIPEGDAFPDGDAKKYICFECVPADILSLLGFEEGS